MELILNILRHWWQYYLPIAFGLFIVPETIALVTGHPENTLSEFVWRTFGVIRNQPIQDWSAGHFLFAGMLAVVGVWTILHLALGILR